MDAGSTCVARCSGCSQLSGYRGVYDAREARRLCAAVERVPQRQTLTLDIN